MDFYLPGQWDIEDILDYWDYVDLVENIFWSQDWDREALSMYDTALDMTRIRIEPCSKSDLRRFEKFYVDIDVLKEASGNSIRQWWTNIVELEDQ